jgi:hypothetical protein
MAPLVNFNGARALVDSMFERLDTYAHGPGIHSYGRYRDVLVRCEDGRWRFLERACELEARGTDVGRSSLPIGVAR